MRFIRSFVLLYLPRLYPNLGPFISEWDFKAADIAGGVDASPVVGLDGTIYVTFEKGMIYALYPSGVQKWSYATGDIISASAVVQNNGGVLYVSSGSYLLALSPSGSLIWKYSMLGDNDAPPALAHDGTVYVVTNPTTPPALLLAVTSTGLLKWSVALGSVSGSGPAVGADGTIYVGADDGNLYAISPTGTVMWKYLTTFQYIEVVPVIGLDRTIYVASHRQLYAVNPTGTLKWTYTTGDYIFTPAAIASDGTVYVGSMDRHIYALSSDGHQKWNHTMDSVITSQPVLGSDGLIYVASYFNLYIYFPDGRLITQLPPGGYVAVSRRNVYLGSGNYLYAFNKAVTGKLLLHVYFPVCSNI